MTCIPGNIAFLTSQNEKAETENIDPDPKPETEDKNKSDDLTERIAQLSQNYTHFRFV